MAEFLWSSAAAALDPRRKVVASQNSRSTLAEAIRAAMKGHEISRIDRAIRQAQMQTDFLILLVNRINAVILEENRCRWLRLALLHERLRNLGLSNLDDEDGAVNEWAVMVRAFLIELLSLQTATELIQGRYFDGEGVLLKDALEELKQQTKAAQIMMTAYDRVAASSCKPELATDSGKLNEAIGEQASQRAGFVVALAKSKMLDDFGEHEAADAVIKPYFLEDLNKQETSI